MVVKTLCARNLIAISDVKLFCCHDEWVFCLFFLIISDFLLKHKHNKIQRMKSRSVKTEFCVRSLYLICLLVFTESLNTLGGVPTQNEGRDSCWSCSLHLQCSFLFSLFCSLHPRAVVPSVLHVASGLWVLKLCAGCADIFRRRPSFCLLFLFSTCS